MLPLALLERKTDMPVLFNNAPKVVGLPAVLLPKMAALVMFHHPCFTALNPLGYQVLLPTNFEMNVVVSLTDVEKSSSSKKTVWTGLLKLSLVLFSVLIWQLDSLHMYFPLSQTCSPMPTAATMLALCASPFPPLGLPALLTMITLSSRSQSACAGTESFHNAHAYFTVSIRMHSHDFFLQCACVFHRRMAVACVHTHTQSHFSRIETGSSRGEECFGLCPLSDKF